MKRLLLVLILVLLSGRVGYELGTNQVKIGWQKYRPNFEVINKQPAANLPADFSLFWNVWQELSQKYVDKSKLNAQTMVYGAISGMVSALNDPYTLFLPPLQNKESKEELNGTFTGIGAQLGAKDKKIVVIAPLPDSPAQKSGVKTGDWIVKVDDMEINSRLTLPEVVAKIRGPKGTAVVLAVVHPGDEKTTELKIVRDTIQLESVNWKVVDKNLALVRVVRFGDDTNAQWDKAIEEIKNKREERKITGVILDLRNNPGGLLTGAVYVASEFLRSGVVVEQQNYTGQTQTYSVSRTGKLLDVPLTVLVNQGTASAGEILAGALQAAGRGKLVGGQTFGKGSVQEVEDLPGGAGLHVTTAKWLLANGVWINGAGLTPDVKTDNDEKTPDRDLQLEKAIKFLNEPK